MKRNLEAERKLELQVVEVTPPRTRRAWLPGAQFAAYQLDTRRWRREPSSDFDWQRTHSWLVRQRVN